MMEERKDMNLITDEMVCRCGNYLREKERSHATVEEYLRDVRKFQEYLCSLRGDESRGKETSKYGFDKKVVLEYGQYLNEHYRTTNMSSTLAAANSLLEHLGYGEYKMKLFKIQHIQFDEPERELMKKGYRRLVQAAGRKKDARVSMLFQTIGSTGVRVSKLRFITVESLGHGRVDIYNKGESKIALLPAKLVRVLTKYYRKIGTTGGGIFITRNGKSTDRGSINKKMKEMGRKTGMGEREVFPHSFCHLSARIFYRIEKNVIRLMDLLGHSSINTTRIYAMNTEGQPRRQMLRMWLVFG